MNRTRDGGEKDSTKREVETVKCLARTGKIKVDLKYNTPSVTIHLSTMTGVPAGTPPTMQFYAPFSRVTTKKNPCKMNVPLLLVGELRDWQNFFFFLKRRENVTPQSLKRVRDETTSETLGPPLIFDTLLE